MIEIALEELDKLNARVAAKQGWRIEHGVSDNVPYTSLFDPAGTEICSNWGQREMHEIGRVPDYTDAPGMVDLILKYKISIIWLDGQWNAQCGRARYAASSPSIGLAVCTLVDHIDA